MHCNVAFLNAPNGALDLLVEDVCEVALLSIKLSGYTRGLKLAFQDRKEFQCGAINVEEHHLFDVVA